MTITEHSRHQLHIALASTLGDEEAATLMQHLPPVGWADVATKRDLDGLEERMDAGFVATKRDLDGLEHRMNSNFAVIDHRFEGLEHRMNSNFAVIDHRFEGLDHRFEGLEHKIEGAASKVEARLLRVLVLGMSAQTGMMGVLLAITHH